MTLLAGAQDAGVRVLLDGSDGDATVSHGMGRLTDLFRGGRWIQFLSEVRMLSERSAGHLRIRRLVWEYAIQPYIRPIAGNWARRDATIGAGQPHLAMLVPDFSRLAAMDMARPDGATGTSPGSISLERHLSDITSAEIPYSLEILDKLAAWHGIQLRYPFFDRRLIEFCLSLPAELKLQQGWTRYVLRESMRGLLPEVIRTRMTKATLYPYFLHSFRQRSAAPLARFWDDEIRELEGIVDLDRLRSRRPVLLREKGDELVHLLYAAIVVARWLRRRRERNAYPAPNFHQPYTVQQ